MAKLKSIIKQLAEKDFKEIYDSLMGSNAEKSAYLLNAFRGGQISDSKIMVELDVNANAYYTLRSRLNQKIEEHLLQQMENPRADILRKVSNLNEMLFTKKRTISIATLKKLEKELLDYDLSIGLTVVYRSLKRLYINTPDYFTYSQLYNRHVAYTLAVDKAEDLLAEYFNKYGSYFLTGDPTDKFRLSLLLTEMQNVAKLYESHRLYVYKSLMLIYHRLFVETDDNLYQDGESIEDIFARTQTIFETYKLDQLYFHLNLVFEFLRLEYYNHYRVYRSSEKYFDTVNDASTNLLVNYPAFTFSAQFFVSKLERSLRLGIQKELYEENERTFTDIEPDLLDVPKHFVFVTYRALSCYYAEKYEDAAKLINNLLNDVSLKKYPFAQMEIKALLALHYCLLKDFEMFKQYSNSIQRQIRMCGKDKCENVLLFLKILKIATSPAKKNKPRKIAALVPKFKDLKVGYFAPTSLITMDQEFIKKLTEFEG